jgi:Right handed beta helix region/Abnormal spindle-like microcephaly-assoc'd, ASPM-SPD-2-Hydin/Disaggregatase related
MRRGFVWLSVICILCTLSVAAAAQSTINVPADQSTIQAAINAANNGDTVVVAPGTHIENLNFNGKVITVTSSDGPAVTIVDGGGAGPVVTFNTNEGGNSVLNGFTLQNGVPSNIYPIDGVSGGGILILNASPTITGNVITGNHAICGIGIEIQGGSAVIRGNTITGNTQAGGDGGCGGGGIEVTGDSSNPPATPLITGNTITNNSLDGGGFGGGIEVSYFSSPTIQNNYIAGNSAYNSGGGIDLESYLAPVVVQNIIVNNSIGGGGSGGGIYVEGPSSATDVVANNTIVGNTAFDGSSGIFTDVLSPIVITNNIVVAASGQNGIVCSPFSSTFPTFSHNDVTSPGSGGQAWSSNCASAAQSNGNISADPQFVDAANGDYHLQAASPAIDAGDNSAPNLPQQDYDGKTRVVDGNNDCLDTVDLGAYELQATVQASFSPTSLPFPNQFLNTTSSAQAVTLSSTGSTCLNVAGLPVTGDFAQSNTCGAHLPAGQSCVVDVTFTPTAAGTRTGTLTLTGNQSGDAPSVTLSGNAVVATASLAPSSLNFGSQLVNMSSAAQAVTLSNTGSGPLQIYSIGISGDFSQSNTCPASLGAGSSCVIQVTFRPTATGPRSGSLSISSNSVPAAPAVSLSGTGVQPAISVSPASIAFGDQVLNTSAPYQTVTVSNPGSATLHVSALSVTGDPDLYTVSNNCVGGPGTAPGGSCSIQMGFTPRSLGAATATLSITSDAPGSPTTVALSGNGVNAAPTLSPTSLSFGNVFVGKQSGGKTVKLTSNGPAALAVSSISVSAGFVQTNNCPVTLNPGSSCSISVSFKPLSAGATAGVLSIADNGYGSPQTVALSGTGMDFSVSASPASATVTAGQKASYTVTVSPLGGSYNSNVALSCSNVPTGVKCSFSPSGVSPGSNSVNSALTVSTTSGSTGTPPGSYTLTINGTANATTHSTTVDLVVN